MSWDRARRVEALLKEKIAVILVERLSDPRIGFVTITRVELSRDRKLARIFHTVLGTDAERRRAGRALVDAAPHIQEILSRSMRMRHMPELRFVYDESIERESHLRGLIDEIAEERERRGRAGPPGAEPDDGPGPAAP